ncbi:MAG: hypothetical protein J6A19_04995 [Oscillospiraceae bacterium]|nr:hypothetical protein [Oscillospiraceae bacterium]
MEDNEQWKSGGNCSKCRRKSYCKKACSASKKALRRDIMRDFARTEADSAMLAISASAKAATGYSYLTDEEASDA